MLRSGLRTAFLFAAVCAAGFSDTLVVPNNQANAAGNLAVQVGASPSRFQEVVGGGQFASLTGPLTITGISLRAAPGSGPVSFSYTSVKITLSTTQAFPNTNGGRTLPSTTYANNVDPDATMVFNGPFSASSPGCASPGPCAFDMTIAFTTPFIYDPSVGRLLVDIVNSATTPTGSLDGVQFPDSTSSTVAFVAGDPTQATGTLTLGGLVLGLDSGGLSTPLSGSFGFLLTASFSDPSQNSGAAFMGVMNLDGAGNVSGTYTQQQGATGTQGPQTQSGNFTGTYSTYSDGTGSVTIATFATFAFVVTDGGQGMQLVDTACSFNGCDSVLISGGARAAYTGLLKGSYGFQFSNNPSPAGTVGVITLDGAGNATLTYKSTGLPGSGGVPSLSGGSSTGTYTQNPDGSGVMNLTTASGQAATISFVVTDGGSGLLLLLTSGTGSNVSAGTARLQ